MWVNVLCTLVEAGGLVLVIVAGMSYWGSVDYFETPAGPDGDHAVLLVMQGAVLAFFAFIGFEDMINVAEETRDPERTVPLGLILAMAGAAHPLYRRRHHRRLGRAVARARRGARPHHRGDGARGAVDPAAGVHRHHAVRRRQYRAGQLRHRLAPDLRHGAAGPAAAAASAACTPRGGRRISPLPRCFSCWRRWRCSARITELAAATVLLLLLVFMVVNGALVILKRRKSEELGRFEVPLFVPVLGALVCFVLIVVRVATGDSRRRCSPAASCSARSRSMP